MQSLNRTTNFTSYKTKTAWTPYNNYASAPQKKYTLTGESPHARKQPRRHPGSLSTSRGMTHLA